VDQLGTQFSLRPQKQWMQAMHDSLCTTHYARLAMQRERMMLLPWGPWSRLGWTFIFTKRDR